MGFEQKNMVVAGGSSGIGLALVKQLVAAGAKVFVVSRNAGTELPEGVTHIPHDFTTADTAFAGQLPDKIHGLVYSVGSINLKPFQRLQREDFLNDFTLNVLGAVTLVQQSLRALKNAEMASVVLFSTVAARTGMSYHTSIAASKGAIESLAVSLAAEFVSSKIRVNAIAPSLTNTPLAQHLLNTEEKQEASAKRHPLGKYGQPDDMANAARFLLSDESSWITGQIIGIDGGLSSLKPL
ncbi:MAG: SDR family NAD(P)-dependent oxidoreductase [Mucilaginibacter sp.]|uniref:SDR family NAD(P)-dependent oxidoreductase n=1 Tax=Mucilaginibacter sp. TaxID=1882438 RepID=UPI0034E4614C